MYYGRDQFQMEVVNCWMPRDDELIDALRLRRGKSADLSERKAHAPNLRFDRFMPCQLQTCHVGPIPSA